jgi:hypothetical protein
LLAVAAQIIKKYLQMNNNEYWNNDAFCPMPWGAIYIDPTGSVDHCCISYNNLGSVKENTLLDIVGTKKNIAIKSDMLDGKKSAGCYKCYSPDGGAGGDYLRNTQLRQFENWLPDFSIYDNPENFQLIKIYETVTELMNEDKNIKRPSIMKAIQENTIYCGFRWQLVARNLDPNIIHNLEQTKEIKIVNIGYVAKLNSYKTEILNVYLDRKTACKLNNYESINALDNCFKNFTIKDGFYYKLYNNCDEELKYEFESKNQTPLLYKNGIGQFDLQGNLIKEFSCKYDVIREIKISDKTLAKALINNVPYNNFYYKELGSKINII